MTDILVRNVDAKLARRMKDSARRNGRSLSDEAKVLFQKGLAAPPTPPQMGDFLLTLVDKRYRTEDLRFDREDPVSPPPSFR
jgi:plasmid stability protein